MLKDVNCAIPNNLKEILIDKNLSIADCVRLTGMTRPTVKKLIEGEDSYLSKMKNLADAIGVSMSAVYGHSITIHQANSSYDNSRQKNVGYQASECSAKEIELLRKRISDLEDLVSTKENLIAAQEELLSILRQ